ncbi:uncharacterized protein LOC112887078 [Panicum hallii]|uniref:uncharacterized protein LOC112887078 n=1 Tax=Panicum hallii TaxID=206008 RepID=UPI000DF4E6F1|nr:uncharacterized protein LOC112887078 [Panicum hallii]
MPSPPHLAAAVTAALFPGGYRGILLYGRTNPCLISLHQQCLRSPLLPEPRPGIERRTVSTPDLCRVSTGESTRLAGAPLPAGISRPYLAHGAPISGSRATSNIPTLCPDQAPFAVSGPAPAGHGGYGTHLSMLLLPGCASVCAYQNAKRTIFSMHQSLNIFCLVS